MTTRPRAPSLCIFCAHKYQQWLPLAASLLQPTSKYAFNAIPLVRHPQRQRLSSTSKSTSPAHLPIRFIGNRRSNLRQAVKLELSSKDIRHGTKRLELPNKGNFSVRELKWAALNNLDDLKPELQNSSLVEGFALSEEQFEAAFKQYRDHVCDALFVADESTKRQSGDGLSLYKTLMQKGAEALTAQLRFGFYGQVVSSRFSASDLKNQGMLADLRYPWEWYYQARERKRKIHLHVGPTNSGKTYNALKRLEEAKSGCYAGPLRLLAHEVYTRLNAKGKLCTLITGDEFKLPPGWSVSELPTMHSSTVEMIPFGTHMEVVVIDEIQMMADQHRGWAWTEAFLGVRADEVHLCGEDRVVPLIKDLTKLLGDNLQIHHYERLNPLKMYHCSLKGKLRNLQKGDCIVSFTILSIHALRRQIEEETGRRCAVVYGSLPPETRSQQAKLFNDPNNDYDFLVASDAIGMGLNLNIKRIIFESVRKSDGTQVKLLSVPEIKQIAGRAGRYRTSHQDTQAAEAARLQGVSLDQRTEDAEPALDLPPSDIEPNELQTPKALTSTNLAPEPSRMNFGDTTKQPSNPTVLPSSSSKSKNVGYVTTFDKEDWRIVARALEDSAPPIRRVGIHPTDEIASRFSSYFPPGTPFSYVIHRLHEIAQVSSRFFVCQVKDKLVIADEIQAIKDLTIEDRLTLCKAPFSVKSRGFTNSRTRAFLVDCARAIADQQSGGILDMPSLDLEILDEKVTATRRFLARAEELHKMLVVYLWLGFRFPGVFPNRPLATHVKEQVEKVIEKSLSMFSFRWGAGRKFRQIAREREMLETLQRDFLDEEQTRVDERSNDAPSMAEREEESNIHEPKDVDELRTVEELVAEEPTPGWNNNEEYPDEDEGDEEEDEEDEEPDMNTQNWSRESSPTEVSVGEGSSHNSKGPESIYDNKSTSNSDMETPNPNGIYDEGFFNSSPSNDEQSLSTTSEMHVDILSRKQRDQYKEQSSQL